MLVFQEHVVEVCLFCVLIKRLFFPIDYTNTTWKQMKFWIRLNTIFWPKEWRSVDQMCFFLSSAWLMQEYSKEDKPVGLQRSIPVWFARWPIHCAHSLPANSPLPHALSSEKSGSSLLGQVYSHWVAHTWEREFQNEVTYMKNWTFQNVFFVQGLKHAIQFSPFM